MKPPPDGEEDTKTSKKSIDLILTFADVFGDNIQSDIINSPFPSPYIDNEGVGVSAGGRSVPNPAAGIHMGMSRKNGRGRQMFLDITCEAIDYFPHTNPALPPHASIDACVRCVTSKINP